MNEWLKFLDQVALEKDLSSIEKETLTHKFPELDRQADNSDLSDRFGLDNPESIKKRFTHLYTKFGLTGNGKDKADRLQAYLKQRYEHEQFPNWLEASRRLLDGYHQELTSTPLGLQSKNLRDVHVPLGLIERKKRPKVDPLQDPSANKGSELYQQKNTTRVEHDRFLAEAVGKREAGKHIVILGEPGAGKTTLLTKVWESLLDTANSESPIIVAWVSLSALGNNGLEDYLKNSWLKRVCKSHQIPTYWESFEELADAGRVWLLLDGADEMGGNGLTKIENDLGEVWARSIRAVITCRLNLWDASPTNRLANNRFQVYRTLDFKYANPAGVDEINEFIDKWFNEQEAGKQLRLALDGAGKERIKDLAKNPLRLTLLCNIWNIQTGLPDTQANLYERFVNKLYDWKADKFPEAFELRPELNRAMGDLAKQGLNRASLRFRFTQGELEEFLPFVKHRKALTDLGWLNCVGEDESSQKVYAFFHPTFQEYFAACQINDWDYFLPRAHIDRPVPCEDEQVPTYRVFEQEWRQTILLWIGRGNVRDELKEEFIDKLTNFREQEENIYSYRAYCIAAICVEEFKNSKLAKEVVQQIIEWAFDYFDIEKQERLTNLNPAKYLAQETLPFTHRGYVIENLVAILRNSHNNYWHYDIRRALEIFAVGNADAIAGLLVHLRNPNLDEQQSSKIIDVLGAIAIGDKETIKLFINLLTREDLPYLLIRHVQDALQNIALGNESTIRFYKKYSLELSNISNDVCWKILNTLKSIAVNHRQTVNFLVKFLRSYAWSDLWTEDTALALSCIGLHDQKAIIIMIDFLEISLPDRLWCIISYLGRVGINNPDISTSLVNFLKRCDLSNAIRHKATRSLMAVDLLNDAILPNLIYLLRQSKHYSPPHSGYYLLPYSSTGIVWDFKDIGLVNQSAIPALIELLKEPQLEIETYRFACCSLMLISMDNQEVVLILSNLLKRQNLSCEQRIYLAWCIGKIDKGNNLAISTLNEILYEVTLWKSKIRILSNSGESQLINNTYIWSVIPPFKIQYELASYLGEIDEGNSQAIPFLMRLIDGREVDETCEFYDVEFDELANTIIKIAVGDRHAINQLIGILERWKLDDWDVSQIQKILLRIVTNDDEIIELITNSFLRFDKKNSLLALSRILRWKMTDRMKPWVLSRLKYFVTNETSEAEFEKSDSCLKILFECAQTLSYPEFHTTWYPPIPTK
jgi:hypothetical protein